jgi:peptidoglycan-N-acetylglucosamine deacetylase
MIWLIAAASTLLIILSGVTLYAAPLLIRAQQTRRWKSRGTGMLALTYDDGPDPTTTPAVLQLLNEHDAPATFYLVGFRAESDGAVCDEIKRRSHEIGTHTHRHQNAWKIGPIREYRDAHRAYESLAKWAGPCAPYRPPFGKSSLPTWLSMRLRGRRVDWWTVPALDTGDTFPDPRLFAEQILDAGGPVVLMHCHHQEPHRRAFVLELTEALIQGARSRGIRLVTMSDLVASCR